MMKFTFKFFTMFIILSIFSCAKVGPGINSMKAETKQLTETEVDSLDSFAESPDLSEEKTNEDEASMISPLIEQKETIVATGYAVISVQNHTNQAQQRLLAIRASKLEAYRSLVEQVYGQYLDANTTIADMVVMSDTFRSKVEGVIYGATVVSITPVGDDTYETTLSLESSVVADLRVLYLNYLAKRG